MTTLSPQDQNYIDWLTELKSQIRNARLKAGLAVNRELVLLYWKIGTEILDRQKKEGWGTKVIEQLAIDLKDEFPQMKGLSKTNLKYMRQFAETWKDPHLFGQQLVDQIPWGHNILVMIRIPDHKLRIWYIEQTIKNGWSRSVLSYQIDGQYHLRIGQAQNNFEQTLPTLQSELAREIIKDDYNYEFLGIGSDVVERDIKKGLIAKLRNFLVELGVGFAFVGSQYHVNVGGDDFYIDLLFYHTKLHCYVVIELKNTDFKPEYTGKLSFYISVVDDLVRDKAFDNPTIGVVLCKGKNESVAEYALRDINKPIGISTYRTEPLPNELLKYLPSIDMLERELETSEDDDTSDEA